MKFTIKPVGKNIFQLTRYSCHPQSSFHYYLVFRNRILLYTPESQKWDSRIYNLIREIIGNRLVSDLVVSQFKVNEVETVCKLSEVFPGLHIYAPKLACTQLSSSGGLDNLQPIEFDFNGWAETEDFYFLAYPPENFHWDNLIMYDKFTNSLISSNFGAQNIEIRGSPISTVVKQAAKDTLASFPAKDSFKHFLECLKRLPSHYQILPGHGCIIDANNVSQFLDLVYQEVYELSGIEI